VFLAKQVLEVVVDRSAVLQGRWVDAGGSGGLREVLRAEKRVGLHPKARSRRHSLIGLARPQLITPGGAVGRGGRHRVGAQLVERRFGLVAGEEVVQGGHVGRPVRLPEASRGLGERAEVGCAAGGGHAPVEARAHAPAQAHARCLVAHGGVEAVGHGGAHGAHHGAGEGRHGGGGGGGGGRARPRRVGQGQAAQGRLVLEETAGQILSLPKRMRGGGGMINETVTVGSCGCINLVGR